MEHTILSMAYKAESLSKRRRDGDRPNSRRTSAPHFDRRGGEHDVHHSNVGQNIVNGWPWKNAAAQSPSPLSSQLRIPLAASQPFLYVKVNAHARPIIFTWVLPGTHLF